MTLVVPYAPGGAIDVLASAFAPGLGDALGRNLVIDTRSGADGNVGAAGPAQQAGPNALALGADLWRGGHPKPGRRRACLAAS